MLSFNFFRPVFMVSAWCIALVLCVNSFVRAADFKPFLTLRIDTLDTMFNIVEKAAGFAGPAGAMGAKAVLTPYKKLPGVNTSGTFNLAVQRNENSPSGLDVVLFLPIANIDQFNVPGREMYINMIKGTVEGSRRMIASPVGEFIAYQKKGFYIIVPPTLADFASTAEPKDLFGDLDKYTMGFTVNLDNLTAEDLETLFGNLAAVLSMQEAGEAFNIEEAFAAVKQAHQEFSVWTEGISIDERTLDITASRLIVPKKETQTAEKFLKKKGIKTKFGGFLHDNAKTVFSWSYTDYCTDNEIAELKTTLQLISDSFIEGINESADEEQGKPFIRFAEIVFAWLQENADHYAANKSVDSALSLDSDGTFLYAEALTEPELTTKIGSDLFNALPELFGEEQGNAFQQLIGSKIKLDYETVAGFSMSSLTNLFVDVPPEMAIPHRLSNIPINVYWAIKSGEAVAIAVGWDAAKTERALKTALGKTNVSTTPKQTAVFGFKSLGEVLSKQVLPLMMKFDMDRAALDNVSGFFSVLAGSESSAKIIVTTEFPNDAQRQNYQIDGKCLTVFIKLFAKQQEIAMKRAILEQQQQQVPEGGGQEAQAPAPAPEGTTPPSDQTETEEMQNPFDE